MKLYQSGLVSMQSIKNAVLRHARLGVGATRIRSLNKEGSRLRQPNHQICSSAGSSGDQILDRVLGLVKKYDKVDANKVTEKADFQKDLCLDSLDKVELVMAIEEEFLIEIPDEKADKLACCADVAEYIISESASKPVQP